jgi:hypothetical protein
MNDANTLLIQLCTENVYNDNVFHLLGLQTTATPKQIRRRREDIEAAHEMGEAQWKREFLYLLGNRPVPTFEEVQMAFDHLGDPEYRIVSEFFWMWPLDDDDVALRELTSGKRSVAINIWEQAALGYGKKRSIAQHNLAVLYQFYAIDAELQAIDSGDDPPAEFHKAMCDYWEKSFGYWEELTDNDDFWKIFGERMYEFNDPRLIDGFIHSLRKQFPVAFDNINARLAAEYARLNKFTEAKRHVDYMLKTMSGLDDVDETMRILFEPMQRKVKTIIRRYDEKIEGNPNDGISLAESLLKETYEIVNVVQGLLSQGHRIRTTVLTDIFTACNQYAVSCGNKTKRWKACLEFLEQLKPLACTYETRVLIQENIDIVTDNLAAEIARNTCCGCGCMTDSSIIVPFFGDVKPTATDAEMLVVNEFKRKRKKLNESLRKNIDHHDAVSNGCQVHWHRPLSYGWQQGEPGQLPNFGKVSYKIVTIRMACCNKCRKTLSFEKIKDKKSIVAMLKKNFKYGWEPEWLDVCEAWGVSFNGPSHITYELNFMDAYNEIPNTSILLNDAQNEDAFKMVKKRRAEKRVSEYKRNKQTGCLIPLIIAITAVFAGCIRFLQ